MSNHKFTTILCDLGNVLINFDHHIAVTKILRRTDRCANEIYGLFFDSYLTKEFEEGRLSSKAFFRGVKDLIGLEIDYKGFVPIWNDIFFESPLNLRLQAFLRSVKATYKLCMISNINQMHFKFLKKKYEFFKIFDNLVLSYEVGCRKPDKEIYREALRVADSRPREAFYIDDRADLVEAGAKFGIQGVAFDGEAAFSKIVKILR